MHTLDSYLVTSQLFLPILFIRELNWLVTTTSTSSLTVLMYKTIATEKYILSPIVVSCEIKPYTVLAPFLRPLRLFDIKPHVPKLGNTHILTGVAPQYLGGDLVWWEQSPRVQEIALHCTSEITRLTYGPRGWQTSDSHLQNFFHFASVFNYSSTNPFLLLPTLLWTYLAIPPNSYS